LSQLGREFDPEAAVPEHDYWPEYGPSFVMDVEEGNVRDLNDERHLARIEETSQIWVERISHIMG
jgi:hypothetical protein